MSMCEMHSFPCLHCHPSTYIRMVQNLIERCLLLRMDREQCVKALAERARIHPLVTLTVWKELLKENKDFFHSYFRSIYTNTRIDIFKGQHDMQQEINNHNHIEDEGNHARR